MQIYPRIGPQANGSRRSAKNQMNFVPSPPYALGFRWFHGPWKIDHFREHIHECLQLAGMTTSPEHRAVFVSMAQAWLPRAQFYDLAAPPEYRHNQTLIQTHKVASM
jgi:hypothetical protein